MKTILFYSALVFFCNACEQQEKPLPGVEKDGVRAPNDGRVPTYNQEKSPALVRFMLVKQNFESGRNMTDANIKQAIVDLTANRSTTQPELPKLHLITGVLFRDLGNEAKAKEYFELEIAMADLALKKTELEETFRQNWRRSKLEAQILLGKTEEWKASLLQLKKSTRPEDVTELEGVSKFTADEVYSTYSLRTHLSGEAGTVRI